MFSNAVGALLNSFTPENAKQGRLRELIIEVQEMEETMSVVDFPLYFESMRELKDLLLEEVHRLYGFARKQDQEVERLTIMVEEKNKAVSTLADANQEEKQELMILRARVRELEKKTQDQEERELKFKRLIARLKRTSTSAVDPPITDGDGKIPASPFQADELAKSPKKV